MGKRRQLSEREKAKIDAYKEQNLKKSDIARRLRRSIHCVTTYLTQNDSYGQNYKGKTRALSVRDTRRLVHAAKNSNLSSAKLKSECNLKASTRTIQRALKLKGFAWKKMCKKPLLTSKHKEIRREFCRRNMQTNWCSVWFTDEKKFNLDGPDCCSYYWHHLGKERKIQPSRQARGGGVLVWGGIGYNKKTDVAILKGKVDSKTYQNCLNSHLKPYIQQGEFLVQDNAPVHVSLSTREWLKDNKIVVIDWPAHSPDLNPIENVWALLAQIIYANGKQYQSISELKEAILLAWQSIQPHVLNRYVESMNDRVFQCISNKGSYTKY